MTVVSWYDIPVALLAGLLIVAAWQSWRREIDRYRRATDRYVRSLLRDPEEIVADSWWHAYRETDSALAEHIHATRVIRFMDTVPATTQLREVI